MPLMMGGMFALSPSGLTLIYFHAIFGRDGAAVVSHSGQSHAAAETFAGIPGKKK